MGSGEQFDKIRPSFYGMGNGEHSYRSKALAFYDPSCSICGYNEDIALLEVHHIDENRKNNELDNLIVLCPMCHKKLTTHKYQLVNRNQIIYIADE